MVQSWQAKSAKGRERYEDIMGKEENERMIKYLLDSNYIDERTAEAMRKVLRKEFVPKIYSEHAYSDAPLPIGAGQTISAPGIVGTMTMELKAEKGMRILEVGSGSGYQAAILAEIVGSEGRIYTVERIPELIDMARKNIERLGYGNVEFIYGDGTLGHPDRGLYDRIIVTAGAPEVPRPLIEQLKPGGKMIIPVGPMFYQNLLLIEKDEKGNVKEKNLLPVMFVPLVGKYGYRPEQ